MSSLHSRGVGGALDPSNDQGRERHVLERKHGIPNKNNIPNESESTAGTTARVTVPGPRQAAQQLGEKRAEIREIISSDLMQEIFLK